MRLGIGVSRGVPGKVQDAVEQTLTHLVERAEATQHVVKMTQNEFDSLTTDSEETFWKTQGPEHWFFMWRLPDDKFSFREILIITHR